MYKETSGRPFRCSVIYFLYVFFLTEEKVSLKTAHLSVSIASE